MRAAALCLVASIVVAGGIVSVLRPTAGRDTTTPGVDVVIAWITDGDTVRVVDRAGADLGRIRLLGVDAPELAHDGQPEQCEALQARARLSQYAPVGTIATLVPDPSQADRDSHGRLLRYLVVNGRDVQEGLVRDGLARAYWPSRPGQRAPSYRTAEASAEAGRRGLWGVCAER